jgi:hypothetical protein
MIYVKDTGHVWSWDDVAGKWNDAGRFGVGNLDDGNAQGQMLIWDDGNSRWVPTDVTRIPTGNQEGDVPEWDATQGEWVPGRPRLGNEDNIYLPGDPATVGAVPVYDGTNDDFTVRPLKLEDLEDGPGFAVALNGDLLAWDDSLKRYVPTTPPAGTLVGLTDVDATTANAGDIITADGAGRFSATAPTAYTKAETDSALARIVAGIEHGIAVQSIANDPPTAPAADEAYIVGTTPTGVFVGHANDVALWTGTAWTFTAPAAKEAHLVEDVGFIFGWTGTPLAWTKISQAGPAGAKGDKGDKGDIGPVGPGLIQAMTQSQYNALAVKDPKVLYVTYGT